MVHLLFDGQAELQIFVILLNTGHNEHIIHFVLWVKAELVDQKKLFASAGRRAVLMQVRPHYYVWDLSFDAHARIFVKLYSVAYKGWSRRIKGWKRAFID